MRCVRFANLQPIGPKIMSAIGKPCWLVSCCRRRRTGPRSRTGQDSTSSKLGHGRAGAVAERTYSAHSKRRKHASNIPRRRERPREPTAQRTGGPWAARRGTQDADRRDEAAAADGGAAARRWRQVGDLDGAAAAPAIAHVRRHLGRRGGPRHQALEVLAGAGAAAARCRTVDIAAVAPATRPWRSYPAVVAALLPLSPQQRAVAPPAATAPAACISGRRWRRRSRRAAAGAELAAGKRRCGR